MKPSLQISACCESDRGLVRSYNEDVCLVNNEDGYFLVADGMGGEAAGELASAFFRDTVVELFGSTPKRHRTDDALPELIVECFQSAHERILAHVDQEPSHKGMGCTAELLVFQNDRIVIGHVGDSRTYRLRNSELVQLTTDHSFVQEQADLGIISQEQVDNHALKNLILRVVGSSETLEVDMIGSDVQPGDVFLLCTDGLSSMVAKEQMAEILSYDLVPEIKATMLIDQANHNGGSDNITALLLEFDTP
ncbi:MAG: protein phosphatase 2C domain-containing protein [Desulfofustis sp.]|jgi:PPM family protein phosphatase